MMTTRGGSEGLSAGRASARRLIKQLRSDDPAESAKAAERFLRLRSSSSGGASDVLGDVDRVKLKHALAVIARENGYESWTAMRS